MRTLPALLVDWGIEALFGTRENRNGENGDASRLQMSYKHRF